MTYYAISEKTGQILEIYEIDNDPEQFAQDVANETGDEVYLIKGEHSGITASPRLELFACERDKPDQEAERRKELEKLTRWLEAAGVKR